MVSGGCSDMGPVLCWDFSRWSWRYWELSRIKGKSSVGVCAFRGLCCARGLGLFLVAAEGLRGLGWAWLRLGPGVVMGPAAQPGGLALTCSLPAVTSPPRHLLRHQSGPGAAGPVPAQLLRQWSGGV